MISFVYWVISVFLLSLANANYKKAYGLKNMSPVMFKLMAFMMWPFMVLWLCYFFWFEYSILSDTKTLLMLFFVVSLLSLNWLLGLYVLKSVKLSQLLPYDNFDKLSTVVVWFFLYLWTSQEVSVFTFFMTIITMVIVLLFSMDMKKLHFPKIILLHLLNSFLDGMWVIVAWYMLLSYSTQTYVAVETVFMMFVFVSCVMITKDSFLSMFKQSKWFYISSFTGNLAWWSWYILTILIMETSWVVIASLLWFMAMVFSMMTMKLVLNDTPTKKQMMLSMIVLVMISLWLIFN